MENSGDMNKETPRLPAKADQTTGRPQTDGIISPPTSGESLSMAERAGAGEWLKKVGVVDEEAGRNYQNEWMNKVSRVAQEYRRITGDDFKSYVIRKMEPRATVTGEDRDREKAETEFRGFLDRENQEEVVKKIVEEEKTRLTEGRETPWQVPIVKKEDWNDRNMVTKSRGRGGEGVEIKTKPVYEMGEEERQSGFEKEVADQIGKEKTKTEQEGGKLDPKKMMEVIMNTSKYWGIAMFADELLEFAEDIIRDGKIDSPNLFRDFRRWKDGKKQKKEGTETTEEDRAEKNPAKMSTESKEPEENSAGDWNTAHEGLRKLSEKVKAGGKLSPSEEHQKDIWRGKLNEIWEDFKGPGTQIQRHEGWKDRVASETEGVIRADVEAAEERGRAANPEYARERRNPLSLMEERLDANIKQLLSFGEDGNLPPNKQESIQLAWYEGVKRNMQAAALTAELALYTELGLDGKPEWVARINEIRKNLSELNLESEYMNFGTGIRERTKDRMGNLSARYVDYLRKEGPEAEKLKMVEEGKKKREEEIRREAEESRQRQSGEKEYDGEIRRMNIAQIEDYLKGRLQFKSITQGEYNVALQRVRELGVRGFDNSLAFGMLILLNDLAIDVKRNDPSTHLKMSFRGERAAFMGVFNHEAAQAGMRGVLEMAGFDLNCGLSGAEIQEKLRSGDEAEIDKVMNRILPDRNKKMWENRDGSDAPTIWEMKEADRARFFEEVAKNIMSKGSFDQRDVGIGAVMAVRMLNHMGIFEYMSEKTGEHGLFDSELVRVFQPEKMMVGRIVGKVHDSIVQDGKPQVDRYDAIKEVLPHNGLGLQNEIGERVTPVVPGTNGLTFQELFFPPDRLMEPYLFATDVFKDKDGKRVTLWDKIRDGEKISEDDLDKKQELFFGEYLRRLAIGKVDKLLWRVNEAETPKTHTGFWVKEVERNLIDIAKGLGYVNENTTRTIGIEDIQDVPQMKRLANFLVARSIHVDFEETKDGNLVLKARKDEKSKLSADVALVYRYGLEGWKLADPRLMQMLENTVKPLQLEQYRTYYETLGDGGNKDGLVAREILRRLAQDEPGAHDLWLSYCKGEKIQVETISGRKIEWEGKKLFGKRKGGLGINGKPGNWFINYVLREVRADIHGKKLKEAGWYEETQGIMNLMFI